MVLLESFPSVRSGKGVGSNYKGIYQNLQTNVEKSCSFLATFRSKVEVNSNANYKPNGEYDHATTLRSASLCDILADLKVYTRVFSTSMIIFSRGYLKCPPILNQYIVLCVESSVPCVNCCSDTIGVGCMTGDCPTGYTCVTATCSSYQLLCETGSYSFGQNECRSCTNVKPVEATYLPGSSSAICPWYCNAGFFKSGQSCQQCPNTKPRFGNYIRIESSNCSWVCNSGYVLDNGGTGLGALCKVMHSLEGRRSLSLSNFRYRYTPVTRA